ncbi:lysophospholipase L1-like esterase [Streptomonospora nanhaiensis]|uniref:Lysophospholipase L1-like esterase n=1 Tax=Streptomonospora nanhaiensis TaxID=1323731 RepID=A0A853BN11_9ACTN|nr:SGNH/GDSL hydrolase family protein [Streptomonospora nanhaiensis]NYI96114.1 lysophospholipase L1-like esterase [Streptomonospora nanhaiensis]
MVLRAARARRIATATAFGGGGITLLGATTVGLLYLQARMAVHAIGFTKWQPPKADGVYGQGTGTPLLFAMMGDSTAAGYAVADPLETPGSMLASGIAAVADRPVRLRRVAKVGATSADLHEQLEKLRRRKRAPDLAVIFIGANDVIRRMRPADSVRHLQEVVRELVGMGTAVVVGTCPDLGTVQPIGQPLRYIARRASRQLAAAQTIGVVEAGGRTVSLGSLLAEDFLARPDELFGPDRFHPSARGYAHAAAAVLPSACAALGLLPEPADRLESPLGEDVLPVHRAAVAAAETGGSEVSRARVGGRERGPRGRWATLMRRRPRTEEVAPGTGAPPVAVEDDDTAEHEVSGSSAAG